MIQNLQLLSAAVQNQTEQQIIKKKLQFVKEAMKKNDNLKVLFTFREQYSWFSIQFPSFIVFSILPLSFRRSNSGLLQRTDSSTWIPQTSVTSCMRL